VTRRADAEAISARGLNEPFSEITFNFVLHREAEVLPDTTVERPHARAA